MTVDCAEKTRKKMRRMVDKEDDMGQPQHIFPLFPLFPLQLLPISIYLGAKQVMLLELHYWQERRCK